jgi:hypothetical protein
MAARETDPVIGYSALEQSQECYEFDDDNACHVSDSLESLKHYLQDAFWPRENYRLETIKFSDFLRDFGYSRGEYTLEPQALARFEQAAQAYGLQYTVEEYKPDKMVELDPKLFLVRFRDWQRDPE